MDTPSANGLSILAVNDIADIEDIAYLLRYDSVHGKLPLPVEVDGDFLVYGNQKIRYLRSSAIADLPWQDIGVEAVVEATGLATARAQAALHLDAGSQQVLIAAPSPDSDFTLVMGVNELDFDVDKHRVVSNASCTTNSLAPPLKVLMENFGVREVGMTTIHAYTSSQGLVDRPAKKMHRGRAAAVSIIPTSTGADKATVQVLPELAGRISACSVRVPVPDGSLTDITVWLEEAPDAHEINLVLRSAAEDRLAGILGYTEEELVSADILGESCSGIVHAQSTQVVGHMAKLQVWYDNEIGYANRCLDAVTKLAM
jgi:glyceraldehyde 3-phosphate dehydrogenase/glyceraldehyde-3-phosphate dehydrogenase (NAD(P))